MLNKLIGIFHIFLGIFTSFYAFIIPKNFLFDFLYILYIIFLLFSWILFNNECVITYYYNKLNNIKKKPESSDLDEIYDGKSFFGRFCFTVTTIAIILSIYIAATRSNITNTFVVFLLICIRYLYVFYNKAVGYDFEEIAKVFIGNHIYKILFIYKKMNIDTFIYPYFNTVIFILNVLIMIYVLKKNWKRIFK